MPIKFAHLALIAAALVIISVTGWLLGDQLLPGGASAALDPVELLSASSKDPAVNRDTKSNRIKSAASQANDAELEAISQSLETARNYLSYPITGIARRAAPAKPVKLSRLPLDDAQIASIKKRLKLTAAQEKLWPPVETALRGVILQVYEFQKRSKHGDDSFDASSPEIQKLKKAANALMATLRGEQKNEILLLAQMAGLGSFISELPSRPIAEERDS